MHLCVCACTCLCAHASVCMWKSEDKLAGVSSLLPPRRSQSLNSGHWAWWQVPLPTEPSFWLGGNFCIGCEVRSNSILCESPSSIMEWSPKTSPERKSSAIRADSLFTRGAPAEPGVVLGSRLDLHQNCLLLVPCLGCLTVNHLPQPPVASAWPG